MSEQQAPERNEGEFAESPLYAAIVQQLGYDPLADRAEDEPGGDDEPDEDQPDDEESSPDDGGVPRTPAAESGDEPGPGADDADPERASPSGPGNQEEEEGAR